MAIGAEIADGCAEALVRQRDLRAGTEIDLTIQGGQRLDETSQERMRATATGGEAGSRRGRTRATAA